jgi:hypothetical protein
MLITVDHSPPLQVEGSVEISIYFKGLADLLGAHQYPYEEYSERRGERLAVKTQNPAFGGRGWPHHRGCYDIRLLSHS